MEYNKKSGNVWKGDIKILKNGNVGWLELQFIQILIVVETLLDYDAIGEI